MRRNFRLLLFLVITISFLLGMPFFTFAIEVSAIQNMTGPNNTAKFADYLKIALLIISHISVVSLLFIKESPRYKFYLIIFPIVFLAIDYLNGYVFYAIEPRTLLSWLPYMMCYIICLVIYFRLPKDAIPIKSRLTRK